MSNLITAAMEAAGGTLLSTRTSYPVDAGAIRRWAIAVYWPEPPPACFIDGEGPLIAPEEFNPFAWVHAREETTIDPAQRRRAGAGRLEKQLGLPDLGFKVILNGGVSVEYFGPKREGDTITSTTRFVGYSAHEGSRGPMLMSTTEDTWTNQTGDLIQKSSVTAIRY
ncbi:MaoC family dehydratase N-terminal domain-containing protein [Microbacterium sp. BWT-B31]|uniref:FAS1-like dehydratase domain-containing protein n=1 Tax=Microbacterium sp. BWT-B31 TaxID=3232072 RepID=UPI003529CECF